MNIVPLSADKVGMGDHHQKKQRLSKSRLMRGLQCPKSLYLTVRQPELEPPVSASQQALFDQGHEVGLEAQKRFPGGITIAAPYYDTAAAVAETEKAMRNGATTIYEAAFATESLTAKIDILHREPSANSWKLIEVKSTTSVKPEHLSDIAIQAVVLEDAGLRVEKALLMHLNNQAVAPALENLFAQKDVTDQISELRTEIPSKVSQLNELLAKPEPPKVDIGPHCTEPYDCPFKAHCWKHVPPNSVFDLPAIGKKAWELYRAGIVNISDPKFIPAAGVQQKRVDAVRKNRRWIDSTAIAQALSKWTWPLLFLDFETIAFAIPRYHGTKPYEQVPFQFSCLKKEEPAGEISEVFYLHEDESDPRLLLVEALLHAVSGPGSIVAYNMSFEARCIEALANEFPKHRTALQDAVSRLVDPLPIFRNSVYDAAFTGSFSIKNVAPAILGAARSYEGMLVADGGAAQRAFLELVKSPTYDPRHLELRNAMLAYCRKDTMEMVDLVNWLFEVSSGGAKGARKKRA